MGATRTLLTLGEFSKLPDYDERTGERYELDHGELIILPPRPIIHEVVKQRVAAILQAHLRESGQTGIVLTELGSILDEDSWRVPDISFLAGLRLEDLDLWKPLERSPELAIEIVSASNTGPQIRRKADHFLVSGAKAVWLLYPRTPEIQVIKVGRKLLRLNSDEFLEEPELLPGFRVKVRDLFP